jgi:trehalose synthase
MHHALQGMYIQWTAEMYDIWRRYNRMNAELFDEQYDFVVIHDPQPAGILPFLQGFNSPAISGKWIWRCHIDLSTAQPEIWDFLRPFVEHYHAAIFTLQEFVHSDLKIPHLAIIPPAIDPLSPKNMDLEPETCRSC